LNRNFCSCQDFSGHKKQQSPILLSEYKRSAVSPIEKYAPVLWVRRQANEKLEKYGNEPNILNRILLYFILLLELVPYNPVSLRVPDKTQSKSPANGAFLAFF
jgi:hypothetical protein